MTVMKVLASANGWRLVLDLNSCLSLHNGKGMFLVDDPASALRHIPDAETRKQMAAQIFGGY